MPINAALRQTSEARLTVTIEEAAKLLGIGRTSAYDAARRGELPTIRIGRLLLVPRVRLEQLLNGDGPAGNRADREDARSSSRDEGYT